MPSHIKLVHLLFPILSDSLPIVDFSYDCLMDTDLIRHILVIFFGVGVLFNFCLNDGKQLLPI